MTVYVQRSTAVALNNDGEFNSFPAICQCHNGDLLVIYRGDVSAHVVTADANICYQRSTTYGATWGAETILSTAGSGRDLRDCGLLRLKTPNYILATYTDVLAPNHDTNNRISTRLSTDDGASWNAAVNVTWSGQGNDRAVVTCSPIQLPTGRILLPVRVRDLSETHDNSEIYYSDDNGSTWAHLARAGDGDNAGRQLAEPSLVQMPSGALLCLMRDGGAEATYYSTSTDGGSTWTTPALAISGNSGSPRVKLFGNRVFVFGRDNVSSQQYGYVYWTTESRLAGGKWYGPWRFRETALNGLLNYGDLEPCSDGNCYCVWSEQQSSTRSDLWFSRLAAPIKNADVCLADSFNRPNSTTIGECDGHTAGAVAKGALWTLGGTGTPRIQSNQLENNNSTGGANADVTFVTGLIDGDVTAKMTPTTSFAILRLQCHSTILEGYTLQLRPSDGAFRFLRLDAGIATQLQSSSQGITANVEYTVRVRGKNGVFDCYLNGSLIFTFTDTTYRGADYTLYGVQIDDIEGNTGKVNEISVAAVDPIVVPVFRHHYQQQAHK